MSAGRQPEVTPWPRPVRYLLVVVFGAAVGVGLLVALYDRGVLPLVGPFVAVLLAPVVVLLAALQLRRRRDRLVRRLADELRSLSAAVASERSTSPQDRPSRASDASVAEVSAVAASALRQLHEGHPAAGALEASRLGAVVAAWRPEAPASQGARRVVTTAGRLSAVLRRADRVRRQGDPG